VEVAVPAHREQAGVRTGVCADVVGVIALLPRRLSLAVAASWEQGASLGAAPRPVRLVAIVVAVVAGFKALNDPIAAAGRLAPRRARTVFAVVVAIVAELDAGLDQTITTIGLLTLESARSSIAVAVKTIVALLADGRLDNPIPADVEEGVGLRTARTQTQAQRKRCERDRSDDHAPRGEPRSPW